jgi:hypothetical protein
LIHRQRIGREARIGTANTPDNTKGMQVRLQAYLLLAYPCFA